MRALGSGADKLTEAATARQRRKLLHHGCSKLVVIKITCGGKHHVPAVKTVVVVGEKLLLPQPFHGLRRAQDRLAQRMPLPETLREQLVHQHVGIVFVDLDFFKNHAALALDVRLGKHRVQHQVGQHIQRNRHVVRQ